MGFAAILLTHPVKEPSSSLCSDISLCFLRGRPQILSFVATNCLLYQCLSIAQNGRRVHMGLETLRQLWELAVCLWLPWESPCIIISHWRLTSLLLLRPQTSHVRLFFFFNSENSVFLRTQIAILLHDRVRGTEDPWASHSPTRISTIDWSWHWEEEFTQR